jgi:hypothetical protein
LVYLIRDLYHSSIIYAEDHFTIPPPYFEERCYRVRIERFFPRTDSAWIVFFSPGKVGKSKHIRNLSFLIYIDEELMSILVATAKGGSVVIFIIFSCVLDLSSLRNNCYVDRYF